MLYIFSEKFRGVVVAQPGFRQADVHMEYVGNLLVGFGAVALPDGIDALALQKFPHGLTAGPQEVVAGRGKKGRGKIRGDVFQDLQTGIRTWCGRN